MWFIMKQIILKITACIIVGLFGLNGVTAAFAAMPQCGRECCCMDASGNTGYAIRAPRTGHTCCMGTAFTSCEWRQSLPANGTVVLVSTVTKRDSQLNPEAPFPSDQPSLKGPGYCDRAGPPAYGLAKALPLFISNQVLLC